MLANIIFIISSLTFSHAQISNITSTDFPMACRDKYLDAQECANSSGGANCQAKANTCVNGCADQPGWNYSEKSAARGYVVKCTAWAGAVANDPAVNAQCNSARTELAACKTDCKPLYNACANACRAISGDIERTEALRKCDANYNRTETAKVPVDPAGKNPPKDDDKEPIPPATADDAVPLDPNDPGTDDDNTGEPNVISQQPALQGVGATPYGNTELSNDASSIDFTQGTRVERGGFQNTGSTVNTGFVGQGSGPQDAFTGEEMKGVPVQQASAGGNGGGGPMSPPMNPNGGGGPNQAGGAGAGNKKNGGGNYRNAAGDYLSRHSPFSYQSTGADRSAAGPSMNRNVANKKNFGPKYQKKENDGKEALHRLFGAGLTPTSYKRNPYGAGGSCSGTVFCPVETFYFGIKQFPNHEINPDSY